MESRSPVLVEAVETSSAPRRLRSGLVKAGLGVAILAWLLFWGKIDPAVLVQVLAAPLAVITSRRSCS
jgi:hypothetical protein